MWLKSFWETFDRNATRCFRRRHLRFGYWGGNELREKHFHIPSISDRSVSFSNYRNDQLIECCASVNHIWEGSIWAFSHIIVKNSFVVILITHFMKLLFSLKIYYIKYITYKLTENAIGIVPCVYSLTRLKCINTIYRLGWWISKKPLF